MIPLAIIVWAAVAAGLVVAYALGRARLEMPSAPRWARALLGALFAIGWPFALMLWAASELVRRTHADR